MMLIAILIITFLAIPPILAALPNANDYTFVAYKEWAPHCEQDKYFNRTNEKILDECRCLVAYSHVSNEHVDEVYAKFDLNYPNVADTVVAFLTCAHHQSTKNNHNLTVTAKYEGLGHIDCKFSTDYFSLFQIPIFFFISCYRPFGYHIYKIGSLSAPLVTALVCVSCSLGFCWHCYLIFLSRKATDDLEGDFRYFNIASSAMDAISAFGRLRARFCTVLVSKSVPTTKFQCSIRLCSCLHITPAVH